MAKVLAGAFIFTKMTLSPGIIFGIVAMLCWGIGDFLAAKTVRKTSIFRTLIWSQIIGTALLILAFLFFFKFPSISLTAIILVVIGTFLSIVAMLGFYKGLQIGTVSVLSPISSAYGAVTVILCLIFLNERLNSFQAAGISLAILGTILVSFRFHDLMRLKFKKITVGVKYGLIAMLGWGILFVFMKPLVGELGWFFPALLIKTMGVFYVLAYTSTARKNISFPKNVTVFIITIGILETVGFLFMGKGITLEQASIVAPVSATYPLITIILARVFFKEILDINQKIGVVAVLAGLVLLAM